MNAIEIIVAIVLFVHAVAHLVGFIVPWRMATFEEIPYKTTLLGGMLNVGVVGIRIVGILWLVTALSFVATGILVLQSHPMWQLITLYLAAFSLLLCILGWPDSKIGVFVNVVILAFIEIGGRLAWLP